MQPIIGYNLCLKYSSVYSRFSEIYKKLSIYACIVSVHDIKFWQILSFCDKFY